jgi:hypothetical protein
VREIRPPGSVRGVLSNEHSYRDSPNLLRLLSPPQACGRPSGEPHFVQCLAEARSELLVADGADGAEIGPGSPFIDESSLRDDPSQSIDVGHADLPGIGLTNIDRYFVMALGINRRQTPFRDRAYVIADCIHLKKLV